MQDSWLNRPVIVYYRNSKLIIQSCAWYRPEISLRWPLWFLIRSKHCVSGQSVFISGIIAILLNPGLLNLNESQEFVLDGMGGAGRGEEGFSQSMLRKSQTSSSITPISLCGCPWQLVKCGWINHHCYPGTTAPTILSPSSFPLDVKL